MKKITGTLLICSLFFACQRIHQPTGWNTKNIQIARDEFGVPHIFGKSDADAAYGLAWAHAEDDFETIQKTVLAGKGLAGRVFGQEGAAIDFFVHLLDTKEIAKTKYEESFSPEFKKVLEGYAAGLNDYAFHHPEELLYGPAFPITAQEISSAYILSLAQMAGADRAVQAIFNGTVPKIAEDSLPKGSNAIAIHPSRTDSGEAFLAINSHQPLEGPVAWYEAHIQSEEGWNALGGLFPGGAMIFHGVNEHLGWAHTVNSPDLLDLFELEMDAEDPMRYRVDGEWHQLEERIVWLKVRLWDWITLPIPKKVWKSIYGPTLVTEKGTYAFRLGALDRIGAPEQWWRMNKAENFTQWKTAMESLQLPNFNTVYADRYDTIYYVSNALLPKRSPGINHEETVAGTSKSVLWKEYHSFGELPQQLNPAVGYLYNTNHSPYKAGALADTLTAAAFPREMGFDLRDNNRSKRFRELMPAEGKINWTQFNQIKFDQTLPKDLAFRTNLQALFNLDSKKYPALTAQITTLASWNKEADIASQGAALFAFVYYYWWDEFTKTGRSIDTILTEEEAVKSLQAAKTHFQTHFGKELVQLGEYQKLVRGDKVILLWGIDDVLTTIRSTAWEKGMRKAAQGESYILMARFGEGLPVLESINVYGASNRPDSPHYSDQMKRFVTRKLKPMTLDKKTVLQQAKRLYHPGN